VVENRAGAAGTTAAEAVAKSAKDGYTAYRPAGFLSHLN
jgi:tripartite-type tricarboxylate transporter receptor subunit TctC